MAVIYKRNKIWYLDYRVDGRRIRKRVGPSKKVAELELKNIEVKLAKGEMGIVERKKKINDYIKEFTKFLEANKKPKTKQRYLEVLSHFQDFLLYYPHVTFLSHIQSKLIEEYKQRRIDQVMPKTVNFEIGFLNYFFNVAIKYNYLLKNPVTDVEKLKLSKKPPRFLSKEEIRLILENCTKRLHPVFLTFLYTGMRKDELRNLDPRLTVDSLKNAI
jgi:site-specific recombinase XerD